MINKKIVILGSDIDTTYILYNYLSQYYPDIGVIVENPQSKITLLRRRAKKIGWLKVIGQIIFILYSKLLCRLSKKRVDKILSKADIDIKLSKDLEIKRVSSVNSSECIDILKEISPDVVILNGTRIVSKQTLNSIKAPFINIHAGVTPKYRGVHGGYWALAERDYKNCGVTVHLVDEGIDTGDILYQATINPKKDDNFCTYPYLQFIEGIKLLKIVIDNLFANNLKPYSRDLTSKLWYHPTIIEYIKNYLTIGVK